jgi:hypothetical protein
MLSNPDRTQKTAPTAHAAVRIATAKSDAEKRGFEVLELDIVVSICPAGLGCDGDILKAT